MNGGERMNEEKLQHEHIFQCYYCHKSLGQCLEETEATSMRQVTLLSLTDTTQKPGKSERLTNLSQTRL